MNEYHRKLKIAIDNAQICNKLVDVSRLEDTGKGYETINRPKVSGLKKKYIQGIAVTSDNSRTYRLTMEILGSEYEKFADQYESIYDTSSIKSGQLIPMNHKNLPKIDPNKFYTMYDNALKLGKFLDVSKLDHNGTGIRTVVNVPINKSEKKWIDTIPIISNNLEAYICVINILMARNPEMEDIYMQCALNYQSLFLSNNSQNIFLTSPNDTGLPMMNNSSAIIVPTTIGSDIYQQTTKDSTPKLITSINHYDQLTITQIVLGKLHDIILRPKPNGTEILKRVSNSYTNTVEIVSVIQQGDHVIIEQIIGASLYTSKPICVNISRRSSNSPSITYITSISSSESEPDILLQIPKIPISKAPILQMPISKAPSPQMPIPRMPIPQMPIPQMPISKVPIPQMPISKVPIPQIPISKVPIPQMPISKVHSPQMPISKASTHQASIHEIPIIETSISRIPIARKPITRKRIHQIPICKEFVPKLPILQTTCSEVLGIKVSDKKILDNKVYMNQEQRVIVPEVIKFKVPVPRVPVPEVYNISNNQLCNENKVSISESRIVNIHQVGVPKVSFSDSKIGVPCVVEESL